MPKPNLRPERPQFSSGPTVKRPGWSAAALAEACLGRSHRSKQGKAKLAEALDLSRAILGLPQDYRIGIVPGSDTGAVEMALWSLLGARGVDVLAWEAFGKGWVSDIAQQLKLAGSPQARGALWPPARSRRRRFQPRCGFRLERHHLGRPRAERRLDPGGP